MSILNPQQLNKLSNSTEYPIYPTRGGLITIDVETPELFFQLNMGVGGTLIVESADGVLKYYPSLGTGVIHPIAGVKVVSAATIDGAPVTTTASNIWWYGGM